MTKVIYCVEFCGSDGQWYQETNWHSTQNTCEEYIESYGNKQELRINWANLIIDENEQL